MLDDYEIHTMCETIHLNNEIYFHNHMSMDNQILLILHCNFVLSFVYQDKENLFIRNHTLRDSQRKNESHNKGYASAGFL